MNIFDRKYWVARGSAKVLAFAGHPLEKCPCIETLDKFLRENGALIGMWNEKKHNPQSVDWYRCICDNKSYDVDSIESANMRKNIRRALSRSEVFEVSFDFLAKNGYQVYKSGSSRFLSYKIKTEEEFSEEILSNKSYNNRKAFAAFSDGAISAFMTVIIVDKTVFGNQAYFDPALSKHYPMNALYFHVAKESFERGFKEFDRGSKPLLHDTNVDDFLIRMGYRLDFCSLGIRVVPPFRNFIRVGILAASLPVIKDFSQARKIQAISRAFSIGNVYV